MEHGDWVKYLYAGLHRAFNTHEEKAESRPVSVLLSLISILTKNIYSASIITLLSKQRTLKNTDGVVMTVVENKI